VESRAWKRGPTSAAEVEDGGTAVEPLRDNKLPILKGDVRIIDSLRRGGVGGGGAGVKVFNDRSSCKGVKSVLSGMTCLQKAATYYKFSKIDEPFGPSLTLRKANLAGVVNVNRGRT
jgi:hypothetical protein